MKPCVMAIGNFDGVHLGHQALLKRLREKADLYHVPRMIYTFDPPTRTLIGATEMLSTRAEKEALLSEWADHVHIATFNADFAARSEAEFLSELAQFQPLAFVIGQDFRFGKGRTGSTEQLKTITSEVDIFDLHACQNGELIKSTRIRECLHTGNVEKAAELLGRPYSARGFVVQGDQLGRTIGYPTANLQTEPHKALPIGTFAVLIESSKTGWKMGMAYRGTRPTIRGIEQRFEVNIFDWSDDLYDTELNVYFYQKLREEKVFSGIEALREQLALDEQKSRYLLAKELDKREGVNEKATI